MSKRLYFYRLFILSFIILKSGSSLIAQQASNLKAISGQLNGIVLDKDNHQPIEYATIELYKTGISKPINGTTTNAKGEFSIKGLDSGIYFIQIEFIIIYQVSNKADFSRSGVREEFSSKIFVKIIGGSIFLHF